jgi:AraC-like DNA-binding protein
VSTLELMQEAYRSDHVWKTRRLAHYADDLWLQYCGEQEDTPASFHEGAPDREDGLVREAAARITAGAFSPMRLQDVAAALGISLSSLTKRFKKNTGSTPIQYMTRLRMEKAKTLLLETGLTVDQISECCGYQNGFYLCRVFIRHFGIPPAQFRSRHKI